LSKPGKGSSWQKSKKFTQKNSKRKPITQVARELGISDTSIHQWRKELTHHGPEAFPGSGHQTPLEDENRRLKRELERVQQERDILKKVVSIFSRESK